MTTLRFPSIHVETTVCNDTDVSADVIIRNTVLDGDKVIATYEDKLSAASMTESIAGYDITIPGAKGWLQKSYHMHW